jgi:hypothetical protein
MGLKFSKKNSIHPLKQDVLVVCIGIPFSYESMITHGSVTTYSDVFLYKTPDGLLDGLKYKEAVFYSSIDTLFFRKEINAGLVRLSQTSQFSYNLSFVSSITAKSIQDSTESSDSRQFDPVLKNSSRRYLLRKTSSMKLGVNGRRISFYSMNSEKFSEMGNKITDILK